MQLKQMLEAKGIQQRELAKAIKKDEATVSRWLNGKQPPSTRSLRFILQYLNRPENLRRLGRRRPLTFDEVLGEKGAA